MLKYAYCYVQCYPISTEHCYFGGSQAPVTCCSHKSSINMTTLWNGSICSVLKHYTTYTLLRNLVTSWIFNQLTAFQSTKNLNTTSTKASQRTLQTASSIQYILPFVTISFILELKEELRHRR